MSRITMGNPLRQLRLQLGSLLLHGAEWLLPPASPREPCPPPAGADSGLAQAATAAAAALTPAQRQPLSVERAVLQHDMRVLRREAADALAALGAAHALVSSARLAQVQERRQQLSQGKDADETLLTLAADYQAWVNDQVRLFDALGLVMRLQVPAGAVLEQVDPSLQNQARHHLASLCLEYERQQLSQRHGRPADGEG